MSASLLFQRSEHGFYVGRVEIDDWLLYVEGNADLRIRLRQVQT